MSIPIIMDCDPGIDDAVALFMILADENIDLLGVTTCAGNQVPEKTFNNARNLLALAKKESIPVFSGSNGPLMHKLIIADYVHGETGLGPVTLSESTAELNEMKAWDFTAEELKKAKEPMTLLATGPLTNIAILLLAYPEVKPMIKEITIMGGACFGGNETPVTEFNIHNDPEAAYIVFTSGIHINMLGLDVTSKAKMYPEEIEQVGRFGTKVGNVFYEILKFFYKSAKPDFLAPADQKIGMHIYDACAAAYVIDPSLFTMYDGFVEIDKSDGPSFGSTVVDYRGITGKQPNASVAFKVEREKFIKLLLGSLKRFDN